MASDEIASVSAVIVRALRETNARDYSPEEIERSVQGFLPAAFAERSRGRQTLVAVRAGRIVGTAALGQERINTVFVCPDEQGRGVGRVLMAAVEALAREAGWTEAPLNASRTAVAFYRRLGYAQAEAPDPAADTTRMVKPLVAAD